MQSSSQATRQELHGVVIADLLGPAEGPEEEVVDTSVRARYLVGQLAPAGAVLEPDEQDDLPQECTTVSDDGEAEEDRLQSESLMPSSMGLTFAVDGEASEIRVGARWGRYERTESDGLHLTESGQNRRVWKRHPAGGTVTIDLTSPGFPYTPDSENPDVVITGVVRQTDSDWLVTLFLVNQQVEPDENKDAAWLFQPELEVSAPDGTAVFRRRPTFEAEGGIFGGPEQRAMAMLHRNRVEFAVGHGVSVHAEVPDPEGSPDRADRITTRVVPWYDVPVTEPPSPEDEGFEWLADLVLDMKELGEMDRPAVIANLRLLTDQYEVWLDRQRARIDAGDVAGYEQAANEAITKGRRALARLRAAIAVLADETSPAFDAFQFANRAMWQQRIRSDYVLRRRRGELSALDEIDVPENRSWRPFQLAFVLLAVPSLADPTHPERTDPMEAIADLLWFPTGGGKTEAYLGVAAYAMALRRLQGDLGGLDAGRGVAVIMRYTLRLLTIQQFQRASTLLCAMEVLRREAAEAGDLRWGDEPFRIGLWVGNRATPGRTSEAEDAIRQAKGDSWNARRGSGTPDQLTVCPWCGETTRLRVEWIPPKTLELGRTLTYCGDEYGKCPFSEAKAKGEGLPVVVVD
ncbi:MAG TPA: helicase, partial [Planctomycetaceae bacterium]|nr:helicase [Planctomycetaceae bacterium]